MPFPEGQADKALAGLAEMIEGIDQGKAEVAQLKDDFPDLPLAVTDWMDSAIRCIEVLGTTLIAANETVFQLQDDIDKKEDK